MAFEIYQRFEERTSAVWIGYVITTAVSHVYKTAVPARRCPYLKKRSVKKVIKLRLNQGLRYKCNRVATAVSTDREPQLM